MSSPRLAIAGALLLSAALWSALPAAAQGIEPAPSSYLAPGFFDSVPFTPGSRAAVEADYLSYDPGTDEIVARGDVVMSYEGYLVRAERLRYNRRTGAVTTEGRVIVRDPKGNTLDAHDLEVTGGFKRAVMNALILTYPDGSRITADSADYVSDTQMVLQNGEYSPCGDCVDAKGRTIGWKMRAARMTYNRPDASVTLEEPVLELLGTPIAWLPWLRLPDPSQPRVNGFRMPVIDYSPQMGATLEYPYFWGLGEDTDILLSPRLMSRQGGLFAAEVTHRFANGSVSARVAAVYQLDRSAFAGTVGDRDWRGSFQTSGSFVPYPQWVLGWTYTAFTDAAFLPDYRLVTGVNSVNQVYATHLSPDYSVDVRLQQFNLLGDVTAGQQMRQATTLPNLHASSVTDLPDDWGQLRTELRVLGVQRQADHTGTFGMVPYVFGFEENKLHASFEVGWEKQWVAPGGLVVTPYLALRGDAAFYDGASALMPAPVSLLTATPIAALDVRWPLIADDGLSSYLFEPIAQLVYRGTSTTAPGITNDDALSFAFDDTNLFTYNHFSGSDRQDTGLRANLGAHYLAQFADGSWLDLIGGQSYFLAGTNGLGIADPAMVGASTGLGMSASHFVVGARAGFNDQFTAAAKVQIDPAAPRVTMAGLGAQYTNEQRFSAGLDYTYIAADPVLGQVSDQHEITARVGVPIDDYWTATATASWDLAASTWLEAGAGVSYDDGYLGFGVNGLVTGPTHSSPNDLRATATFSLKGPSATNPPPR